MRLLPPSGRRRSWVHYGVMLPGLPEPHRFFNVMAIVGTPGVALFDNPGLVRTTPNDTAYVVSATSSMTRDQFRAYSISDECSLTPSGARFGADLTLAFSPSRVTIRRAHPEVGVELELDVTDVVTRFVTLPGVYIHWSRLGFARGRVGGVSVAGLCTLEYARGVGLHSLADRPLPITLPARLFTYHVLNVDDETQLLFTHVLGPLGVPLQRAVHVRTRSGSTALRRGHAFEVHEYAPEPRVTPDGRAMRLPRRFTWRAGDVRIDGRSAGDWTYGLGAGYVGSYDYEGTYAGRPITGRAYVEYIDLR